MHDARVMCSATWLVLGDTIDSGRGSTGKQAKDKAAGGNDGAQEAAATHIAALGHLTRPIAHTNASAEGAAPCFPLTGALNRIKINIL